MKKFVAGLIIGLVLCFSTVALASSQIRLIVDGREIASDVPPQIIGGRTMVPVRFVAEALNATVAWDPVGNAVIITSNQSQPVDIPIIQNPAAAQMGHAGDVFQRAVAEKSTIIGSAGEIGRDVEWPAIIKIRSYDNETGDFVGQVEWTTLDAITRIEGTASGSLITFREVDFIKQGNCILNITYVLELDNTRAEGTWLDENTGRKGPVWMQF